MCLIENYRKKLFLFFLVCLGFGWQGLYAQVTKLADESRNYVYFHSDSILYAEKVRLRTNMLNNLQLRADSKRIPLQNVKFFNTDEGFFATMHRVPGLANEQFSERIIEGKINIFQERPDEYWNYGRRYRRSRNKGDAVSMRMYFNKGYDDLKKVNYANLSQAMADDVESINLLKGYHKNAQISKAMYISAGAALGAAVISFLVTSNRDNGDFDLQHRFSRKPQMPNYTASYILMGAGVGLAIGGSAIYFSNLKKLEAAVDYYNRATTPH